MGTRRSCLFKWPNPRWPLWLPHDVTRERPRQIPAFGVLAGWASDSQTFAGCLSPVLAHGYMMRGMGGCRLVYMCTHTPSSSRPHSHPSPHAGGVRGCRKVGSPSGVLTSVGTLFLPAPFHPLRHGLHLASFPPWRHPGATLKPTEEWPPIPAGLRRFAGPRREGEGLWDLPCLRLWASVGSVAPGLPARQGLGRMNE